MTTETNAALQRKVQNLEIKNKELILELRQKEDMLTIQHSVAKFVCGFWPVALRAYLSCNLYETVWLIVHLSSPIAQSGTEEEFCRGTTPTYTPLDLFTYSSPVLAFPQHYLQTLAKKIWLSTSPCRTRKNLLICRSKVLLPASIIHVFCCNECQRACMPICMALTSAGKHAFPNKLSDHFVSLFDCNTFTNHRTLFSWEITIWAGAPAYSQSSSRFDFRWNSE